MSLKARAFLISKFRNLKIVKLDHQQTTQVIPMKAYQITNEEGGIDALSLNDIPEPTPQAHEVLMRVNASSINSRDLSTIENPSVRNLNYPFIPNSDGAGEVVAVGSAVTKFKVGDRVLSTLLQSWQDGDIQPVDHANALGGTLGGMLCEYRALPESGLVRTPEHLKRRP